MEQFKKWRVMIITVAFIVGLMLFAWCPAEAGFYPVVSAADDGSTGTLRWAINEINSTAEDDFILFLLGWDRRTIILDEALPVIESNVLIWGPGARRLTIERSRAQGTPQFRIFTIAQGKAVTIRGLTLTNGYIEDDGIDGRWYSDTGGAILAEEGCALTIKHCVITDNHAVDDGGGIFVHSTEDNPSTLTIIKSTVSDNVAEHGQGGGVYLHDFGTLKMDRCRIVDNQASDEGGGIFTYSDTNITVTKSNISYNRGDDGGGMQLRYFNNAVIRNSTFIGNEGEGNYVEGGGLSAYLGEGDLEISDCVFRFNKASGSTQGRGGGIHFIVKGSATISRCTVSDNTAGTMGNEYGGEGGGIFQRSSMTLIDTTISSNTAIGGTRDSSEGGSSEGGGINNWEGDSELTAINCTISGNTATTGDGQAPGVGGGVFIADGASATLINSTLTENSADDGAVYVSESDNDGPGSLTLSNTIVANQQPGCADCAIMGDGLSFSDGYNIDSDNTCKLTEGSDMPMTDPMLGPLADNGGPTLTHALLYGSPAIDAGDCDGGTVTEDQRSVERPQGEACDIGAFEYRDRYCPRGRYCPPRLNW